MTWIVLIGVFALAFAYVKVRRRRKANTGHFAADWR